MQYYRIIFCLFTCLVLSPFAYSQSTYKSIFSSVGEFSDAAKTDDGAFIAIGSSGNAEIVKISDEGELIWTTSLVNEEISFVRNVAINEQGDIFVLGHINIDGIVNIVVFKLDREGVFQGSKRLFHSSTNSGWDLVSDNKDGFYILGGGCGGDNFLIHCNADMEIIFQRGYSVLLAATSQTIEPLSNGHFIISGTAYNAEDGTRPFQVFEVNPEGELIWSKIFQGYTLGHVMRVIELANGDLAMLYYAKTDPAEGTHIFVTRMTSTGDPIWTRILQHEWEQAKDFVELEDGGLMLVGYNRIVNDGDAMIAKLTGEGELVFVRNVAGDLFNSNGQQYINKILPICEDKFAVFGFIDGMVAGFINDEGEGFCETTEVPVESFALIEHELEEIDYFVIQSPLTFEELDFEVAPMYDFLIENNFCLYMDPEDTSCMTSSTSAAMWAPTMHVYPNPTSDFLMIDLDVFTDYSLTILDHQGRTVMAPLFNRTQINVQDLASGIYGLQLKLDGKTYLQRFVKE